MADDTHSATDELPLETDEIAKRAPAPPEGVRSALADGARDGSIALLAGGAALVAAARSTVRGRLRAVLQLALGAALVRIGLRQRRAAEETVDERVLGGEFLGSAEDDGGEDGEKEVSDGAHTAVHDDSSLEPEFDDRSGADSNASGTDIDAADDVTFTEDDEPRTKSDLGSEVEDPRRKTDGDEVEIDVSDAATADEASEATGPDPEQAQPTRTEGTEPEPEVEEDASHMRADTPDGRTDGTDEEAADRDEDAWGGEETETDAEDGR